MKPSTSDSQRRARRSNRLNAADRDLPVQLKLKSLDMNMSHQLCTVHANEDYSCALPLTPEDDLKPHADHQQCLSRAETLWVSITENAFRVLYYNIIIRYHTTFFSKRKRHHRWSSILILNCVQLLLFGEEEVVLILYDTLRNNFAEIFAREISVMFFSVSKEMSHRDVLVPS